MQPLSHLARRLKGELFYKNTAAHRAQRVAYATDASVFQELPRAVALPAHAEDIKTLILFARDNGLSLIPRAAGTSLAGQVVGNGIVVDVSAHFTQIKEVNVAEKWAKVQPGVIRDDLNVYLKPIGLMFGPETSTANRAMIGGMAGNNSCGLHSISWGTTRDHLLEVTGFLSDGSEVVFKDLSLAELEQKCEQTTLEGQIYRSLTQLLVLPENQDVIRKRFPKPSITRRNTGYALDALLDRAPFATTGKPFSICPLIAGSEGTLCFITEVKIGLMPLPPAHNVLVAAHFSALRACMEANVVAMQHRPAASELVDKRILDFTIGHPYYESCRFFIERDPEAVLMVEFFGHTAAEAADQAEALIRAWKSAGMGYAFPVLHGKDIAKAWDLRKGGLGLLRNMPGDEQPVNLIEDCAVDVADLPDYTDDIAAMLRRRGLQASYYAHAGAGELHIEPMMNLKTANGQQQFREVLAETVELLKKYNGSLSGEHGDGRLRGEFIPVLMGDQVYQLFRQVKRAFDPQGVLNAGKIVDAPQMNTQLRYQAGASEPVIPTVFQFMETNGILRMAEKCSGSGDCRKTHLSGGTMCPSYMATRRERDTTRARANLLRRFLTESEQKNRFDHREIKDVMDLCLSCKACKHECPSAVDVGKMKAEFLQQYYDANGTPMRARLVGHFAQLMNVAGKAPHLYNFLYNTPLLRRVANRLAGFHPDRTMPLLHTTTLRKWYDAKWRDVSVKPPKKGRVYLFCDEFTNYNDVEAGQKTVLLLRALGYEVILPEHRESGRTWLSKGLVREAQKIAIHNVQALHGLISSETPLIGIEPSAILTFRDEYPDLVPPEWRSAAQALGQNALLLEEWFAAEIAQGRITPQQFTAEKRHVKIHGHCHQKALTTMQTAVSMLSLPENYTAEVIPSGCCGMAGSFGYEREHYDLSIQIGELVLFPAVRAAKDREIIAAAGTSCRHQIKDGTGKYALHPAEVLWGALA
jgi:FAD/FMN-containing dehydrogenase/Fe-S oxidoreductase